MNIIILGNMEDLQSGLYIVNTLVDMGNDVRYIDTRRIVKEYAVTESQEKIKSAIDNVDIIPDIILVLKGSEMTEATVRYIKEKLNTSKLINWFFDVYMDDKKIWENTEYLPVLKLYDYFFCSLKGVADKLNELGYTNAKFLPEACFPELHGEQYINNFQIKKYSEDVSFCGTIGLAKFHPNRIPILDRVALEGFYLKIYGHVAQDWKYIPMLVKECHTKEVAINERHSIVAQTSLINLGIDQDPELSLSQSARMYRVMCAGGLYLTTYVKDLETMFKINGKDEPIRANQELVVYYDQNDLVEKIDFLLLHDDIRKQIAKNGQECVIQKHTFQDRLNEMMEVIKNGK